MNNNPSQNPSGTTEKLTFDKPNQETERELGRLKKELGVDENNTQHKEEIRKVEEFFRENKDKITHITHVELQELKESIMDPNTALEGELAVATDGGLEFNKTPEAPTNTPQNNSTTNNIPLSPSLNPETITQLNDLASVPEQSKPEPAKTKIMKYIVSFLSSLGGFGTFLLSALGFDNDRLAQINGFENAQEQDNATLIMKILSSTLGSGEDTKPLVDGLKNISPEKQGEIVYALKQKEGLTKNSVLLPSKVKEFFKQIFSKENELEGGSLSEGILSLIRTNEYSILPEIPEPTTAEDPVVTTPQTPENTEEVERQEKLSELGAAEKADADLAKAIQDNPTGDPKITEAQEVVNNIKNASKERIITSLKTAEEKLGTSQNEKKVLEQELATAKTRKDVEKIKELEGKIQELNRLIENLQNENNGIIRNIRNIAEQNIKNPNDPREKWEMKEDVSAKISVEGAQNAENEVKKIESSVEGEMHNLEEEKIQEKFSEIKQEVKEKVYNSSDENEKNKIDSPEVITKLKEKLYALSEEEIEKAGIVEDKKQLEKDLQFAEAKIDLIKNIKIKEKDMASRGRSINFENTKGWVDKSGNDTLEVDVDANMFVDETFLKKDHPVISGVGGLDNAVVILLKHTEQLNTGDGADFVGKDGKTFKIQIGN